MFKHPTGILISLSFFPIEHPTFFKLEEIRESEKERKDFADKLPGTVSKLRAA